MTRNRDLEADVAQSLGLRWGRYSPRERTRTDDDRKSDERYRARHREEIKARHKAYYERKRKRLRLLERIVATYFSRHPDEAKEETLKIVAEEGFEG